MALNASGAWRPAAVLAAALIADTLVLVSPQGHATAATQQALETYIVRFRPDAVERPPKPTSLGLPQAPRGPQLREQPRGAAIRLAAAYGGRLGHVYEYAIQGFSISLPTLLDLVPDGLKLPRKNPEAAKNIEAERNPEAEKK